MSLKQNRSIPSSNSFIDSFEHRIKDKLCQQMPTMIKTLANLCQILDEYSLANINIEKVKQGAMNCILWNDDHSYPIALDQNNYLIQFRQSIREYIYEFLEFSQQTFIVSNKNNEINHNIQISMKYLSMLNDYRIQRESAYDTFCNNYQLDDTILILNNIDQQHYHELRLIALDLRQFFLNLIKFIDSQFQNKNIE